MAVPSARSPRTLSDIYSLLMEMFHVEQSAAEPQRIRSDSKGLSPCSPGLKPRDAASPLRLGTERATVNGPAVFQRPRCPYSS